MSNQDIAKSMIDQLPDADTLEAFAELDAGGGHTFTGSTSDLFEELLED